MRPKKRYMGAEVNKAKDEKDKEAAKARFAHLGKKQFKK